MNKKKILQILFTASIIAGSLGLNSDSVKATKIENNTQVDFEEALSTARSIQKGKVVNITTNLRVRSGAGTNYSTIGYLNNGDEVSIKAESGSWYRIDFNGKDGFVSKEYINIGGNSSESTTTKKGQVVNVTSALNVRQSANKTSAIIGSLHNGDTFEIIAKSGEWYHIKTGSLNGFIHGDYVKVLGGSSNEATSNPNEDIKGEKGKVVNVTTNLRVRKSPSTTAEVEGYLLNGEEVDIIGESGDWYKVNFKGKTGYVSKEYIKKIGSTSEEKPNQPTPPSNNENTTVSKGKVVNISSQLRIRAGAGTSYATVGYLRNGEEVEIIGESNEWYKIKYDGITGYAHKDYIKKLSSSDSSNGDNSNGTTVEETVGHVYNAPSGLSVRENANTSSKVLGYIQNGSNVTIVGESGDFYKIKYGNAIAYVHKDYIKIGEGGSSSDSNNSNTSEKKFGQVYNITSNLRVRTKPDSNSTVLGYLLNGQNVQITGESGNWYEIIFNESTGYVSKDYIKIVNESDVTTPSNAYATILNAMKEHLGSPYVWGGSGEYLTTSLLNRLKRDYPSQTAQGAYTRAEKYADKGYRAFDCSGLMQWGFRKAGITIGRSTWDQIGNGREVSISDIKPGDLLFYSNLEHVGMYVGNGQWIEAPNKNADVRIVNVPWSKVTRARRILN